MWAPTARKAASKPPSRIASRALSTFASSSSSTPRSRMRCDLGVEHVARQPVVGDAEAHHAAGQRAGLADRHRVAEAGQVVGGGEPGRAGADHQHPLARRLGVDVELPAPADRLVAEEALDRVDADRLVELGPVAGGLARVVADPPHDRRERVVLDQLAPGALVAGLPLLGLVQPGLDVLAGRAGVVAGRQPVDVDGALGAPAAGLVGEAGADVERDRVGLVLIGSSPKRRMLASAIPWIRSITSVRGGSPNRCA